jgi:23S rRNA (guanosine2251-2'-O)-methyltransferase
MVFYRGNVETWDYGMIEKIDYTIKNIDNYIMAEKQEFKRHSFKKPESKEMVFGIRAVEETLRSGKEIEKVYFTKGQLNLIELKELIRERNIPFSIVPEEKLNSFTLKNHQGVICFTSPVNYSKIENIVMDSFDKGKNPLILILDRVTDVRNFGAIARTAECAGVDAILIATKGSAMITADAIKTSSGALNFIPVCREENLKNTIKYLKDSGLQVIGCTEKGGDYIYKANLSIPTALVLGSEEDGISDEYLKLCDSQVMIPMSGQIASLNVSVAAGVLIYEAIRQRL